MSGAPRSLRAVAVIALAFVAGVLLTLAFYRLAHLTRTGGTPASPQGAAAARATATPVRVAIDDDPPDPWPSNAPSPEQVLYAQPRLLRDALSQLTPRVVGKPNLYVVAFAGDGGEDVFRNEANYAARLFPGRFGPSAHALILQNNPAELATRPLASWSNLEGALSGLSQIMQPEDILLLYITSHGDEEHNLLVDMEPLPLDSISATDLAGILREHPVKWKVVVVNACYSGGFVPPLRGAGTMVITAARSDRSSFGCGSDSDITYFGKAWLVDGLNHTDNFVDAFKRASADISQWEHRDQLTPSEPQIDIGNGISGQLALWRKGITPTTAVPFKPLASRSVRRMTPPITSRSTLAQ